MIVNKANGVVVVLCNVAKTEAPVTFCKCDACVEARKLHRKHVAVVVVCGEHSDAALAWREAQKRRAAKKTNEAWRALKEAEKATRRAGPFNGVKGLSKLVG